MLRDVQTAASELRVGQSTLRRWIREGKLPVVRLGRRVLLRPAVIKHLVATHEVPSQEVRTQRRSPRGQPAGKTERLSSTSTSNKEIGQ